MPDEVWRPEPVEAWWRPWVRGWRLAVVVMSVLIGIGIWRGARDYRSLKAWSGRASAERALEAAANGRGDEAQRLLDRAGAMAPRDPFVLRTIADFAERRSDVMALYALRQLEATGEANEADLLRLARLALDWRQPGLVPEAAVRRWAEAPVEKLDVGPLEIGARWLAARGMEAPAEVRMRRAMELAAGRGQLGEARRLNLGLASLLASPASGRPGGDRLREAVTRWLDVGKDAGASDVEITEALTRAVAALAGAGSEGAAGDWRDGAVSDLREVLAYRSDTAPASSRLGLRLAQTDLDLLSQPLDRSALAEELARLAESFSVEEALTTARWLVARGFFGDALRLARVFEAQGKDASEWLVVSLNAWLGKKEWEAAIQALADSGVLLSDWERWLWRYRIERAAVPGATGSDAVRRSLQGALRRAEGADALEAAGILEGLGDRALAIEVYRQWQRHDRFGMPARVGLVRCLHAEKDDGAELVEALQSLLTMAPDLEEAKGDLAYLRLLPPQEPRREDIETAKRLAAEAPQFLAFRVVAALAALREERWADADEVFGDVSVPWEDVPAHWRVVRACSLAANHRLDEARALISSISRDSLRPGEIRLLESFSLTLTP